MPATFRVGVRHDERGRRRARATVAHEAGGGLVGALEEERGNRVRPRGDRGRPDLAVAGVVHHVAAVARGDAAGVERAGQGAGGVAERPVRLPEVGVGGQSGPPFSTSAPVTWACALPETSAMTAAIANFNILFISLSRTSMPAACRGLMSHGWPAEISPEGGTASTKDSNFDCGTSALGTVAGGFSNPSCRKSRCPRSGFHREFSITRGDRDGGLHAGGAVGAHPTTSVHGERQPGVFSSCDSDDCVGTCISSRPRAGDQAEPAGTTAARKR